MENYQAQNQYRPGAFQKGHLKIFFGYAAGVGKTYAMLEAAHQAQNRGIDVVVGYIERHTRPDTLALLEGLEQLPEKIVEYKGISLKELDLDAALQRRPNILLVDELAHSNAAGCRHSKRYQDVEELLRAGISVYTTVNVQHLESLNDLVASITHIAVSERIPDSIFDSADQVEIALRRTADQLSKKAQKAENETAAKAGEHILTCLSSAPSNAKVIRTAARMAEAFHSGFTALFVETPETRDLKGENLKRLRDNMRLAEQLGARIATVYGDDPAVQIAEYAKVSGVTKIVLGRTNHSASLFMKSKPLVDRLTSRMEDVDVYIIPDVQPLYKKKRALLRKPEQKFDWKDLGKSLLLTLAATGISFLFYELDLREANIIIVYLLGVLLTAVWTNGYFYGVLVSLLSVVSFNFFFTIPRFSLTALDPNYPVTFLVMMLASCLSCSLATRVKRQGRQSAQRAYYMELLMSSNQKMQQGQSEQEIIRIAAQQLQSLLGRPVLYALLEKDRQLRFHAVPASESEQTMGRLTAEELGVAEWVAKNDKHAGATTSTLSHAQNLYLSVRGNQEVMAVVGIPSKFYPPLDTFEKNLMIAMLDECGLILERRKLRAEKQAAEMETQREQLRANLLRAISHDLRTPLTAISGNAGMLMEKSVSLNENRKQEMYRSIYDDSMWLVNLTENLLSITRIENGTLPLRRDAEMIGDIFHEALSHVDRRAAEHEIRVELEDDMLMANMDARLIVQVIINIVNNAVKYTPEGSDICLSAKKENSMVRIEIADNGPGISDEAKQRLFDMFYTVNTGSAGADSRRGLGLGLSLCKSIVEAHGGSITVHDNQPHGSVFSFTLPLEEVKIQNV